MAAALLVSMDRRRIFLRFRDDGLAEPSREPDKSMRNNTNEVGVYFLVVLCLIK